jgi:hypothetical protein
MIRSAVTIIVIDIYVNCESKLEIILKSSHSADSNFCFPVIQLHNLSMLTNIRNHLLL